jgi:hypothetical protein
VDLKRRSFVAGGVVVSLLLAGLLYRSLKSGSSVTTARPVWGDPQQLRGPVVDLTSLVGTQPNGDLLVQTATAVEPGRKTVDALPECVSSERTDAGANCTTLCVSLPTDATVTSVAGFAREQNVAEWKKCSDKTCLPEALFEPSGYMKRPTIEGFQVCWGFRNWSEIKTRVAILQVTFQKSKRDSLSLAVVSDAR